MVWKNRAALAAGVVSMGLVLAACGTGAGTDTATDVTVVETDTVQVNEPATEPTGEATGEATATDDLSGDITFQTWNLKNDTFTPYFDDLIAEFESLHPGTTINWIDHPAEGYQASLSAAAAAGNLPDVMDLGPELAYTLAQAGALVNLAEVDPSARDQFLPQAWDGMTFDGLGGGTYGFPWYLNTGPAFFNTAIFEQCGLDPNNLPTNFDELFEQAEILSTNCPDRTMVARMPAIETFGEYGVPLMNEDGTEFTFNDQRGVDFVQRFVDLYQRAGITQDALNALQTNEVEEFMAGRLAYLAGSAYTLGQIQAQAPEVAETLAIAPRINNAAPNMYIQSLGVNANSHNMPLAIEWAKFVTNAANQIEFCKLANVFPSAEGALNDPWFTESDGTPERQVIVDSAKTINDAVVWWPPAFSGDADANTLREQIALAVMGNQTAQEALDNAASFSNDRLARH